MIITNTFIISPETRTVLLTKHISISSSIKTSHNRKLCVGKPSSTLHLIKKQNFNDSMKDICESLGGSLNYSPPIKVYTIKSHHSYTIGIHSNRVFLKSKPIKNPSPNKTASYYKPNFINAAIVAHSVTYGLAA